MDDKNAACAGRDKELAKLVSMGFHPTQAEEALEATNGTMEHALGYLLSESKATEGKGIIDSEKKTYQSHADHVPWTNPNEDVNRRGSSASPNEKSKQKAPHTVSGTSRMIDASTSSSTMLKTQAIRRESGPSPPQVVRQPGAEAIYPSFPAVGTDQQDETYLEIPDYLVSDMDQGQQPRGASSDLLVIASPVGTDDDAVTRRDLRHYVIGCAAIALMVLVAVGVALALVFTLGGGNDNTPSDGVESSGPPITVPTSSPPTSTNGPSTKLGDGEICSDTTQCLNKCCASSENSAGGDELKCTSLYDGFDANFCVPGTSLGAWEFCNSSTQCINGCCSNSYSDDGKLKCTPGINDPSYCVT
jgi:hypothetical protein